MNVSAEMLRKQPTVFKCLKRVAVELLLMIVMMKVTMVTLLVITILLFVT